MPQRSPGRLSYFRDGSEWLPGSVRVWRAPFARVCAPHTEERAKTPGRAHDAPQPHHCRLNPPKMALAGMRENKLGLGSRHLCNKAR
jgi:hypothetical protein